MKRWTVGFVVVVLLGCTGQAKAAVSIETVPVGNPGNNPDTTGYGGVGYTFSIGKYEVTNAQYCEFLNAKAQNDLYALYDPFMGSQVYGGIFRLGGSPTYSYSVKQGYENLPVNYVSWYDTLRFANWLTNGQDNGDTETGSYTIALGGPDSGTVTIPTPLQRAAWATGTTVYWLLPSEDEWYKAAYHKNDGVTDNYWDYPSGTQDVPANTLINPDPGNNANFYDTVTGTTTVSPYLTNVGEFENSDSPYGTFDQGGNVKEWNETAYDPSTHTVRGGSFYYGSDNLLASYRYGSDTTYGYPDIGFRVARVVIPEPSTFIIWSLLGALGITIGWWRRRRTA